MNALLESAFKIMPEEQRKVLLMFVYSMCAVSAPFVVGRTVSNTLFLKRIDKEYIPWTYILMAVAVSLVSVVYTRIAARFRRDHLIIGTSIALAAAAVIARGVLEYDHDSLIVMAAIYVLVEIMGSLCIIQFWTFANDIFTSREAKRLFGFIAAGGVLSNVIFGGLVKTTVSLLGAPNLLFIMGFLLLLCAVFVLILGRMFAATLDEQHRKTPVRAGGTAKAHGFLDDFGEVFKSKHLFAIAGIIAITAVVSNIIDYQWKIAARQEYGHDENGLAAYFGSFFLYSGLVACFFQFFITGRLLEHFGILLALTLLPGSMMAMSGAILIGSLTAVHLWAATGAKSCDTVFRYTVNDATVNLLYLPVPNHIRPRAKAIIDGILKPVSIGITGFIILGLTALLADRQLSYVSIALLACWLYLVAQGRKQYMLSLAETIRKKKLDLAGSSLTIDDSTIRALELALQGNDERDTFNALELLPAVPKRNWDTYVVKLLEHPKAALRERAVAYLGRKGNIQYAPALEKCFEDEDPDVRARAITAYCAVGGERSIRNVTRFLKDDDPDIKSATIAGMIQNGGLDGILMAAEELKAMLHHTDPHMRIGGAKVLEAIKVRNFYHPLLELLGDKDTRVITAAIRAAGEMQSPELVPSLIYKLAHKETARAAGEALAKYGHEVVAVLAKVLGNAREELAIRLQVPRILERVGSQECANILLRNIQDKHEDVRHEVIIALDRLSRPGRNVSIDTAVVAQLCHEEIQAYFQQITALSELEAATKGSLLYDALHRRSEKTTTRVLHLLAIMYPSVDMEAVALSINSPAANVRANAIELLDNTLEGDLKRGLIVMLEKGPLDRKVASADRLYTIEHKSVTEWLARFAKDENQWLVATTLYQIGIAKVESLTATVHEALKSTDAMVRETALRALQHLMKVHEYAQILATFIHDDSPMIAAYAQHESAQLTAINNKNIWPPHDIHD